MRQRYCKWIISLFLLLALLAGSVLAGLCLGEINFSLPELFALHKAPEEDIRLTILQQLRIPRVLLGLFAGGALSLSGVILQGIFRNPLVEPYTLGISGGASLGVAVAIILSMHLSYGSTILPLAGFLGAFATIGLVYLIGIRKGHIRIHSLLLTGVMISFISSSFLLLIMSMTRSENLQGILFWTMGSLTETNPFLIGTLSVISLLVFCISLFYSPVLNAMRLGIEKAALLGFDTDKTIKALFLFSSLLTGICVSVVGVIGFVGLIVPQVARLMVGTDYRALIPCSFLGGGLFMILSDLFSRTIIKPNELPIGVITGIIGGIAFIIVMSQNKKSME